MNKTTVTWGSASGGDVPGRAVFLKIAYDDSVVSEEELKAFSKGAVKTATDNGIESDAFLKYVHDHSKDGKITIAETGESSSDIFSWCMPQSIEAMRDGVCGVMVSLLYGEKLPAPREELDALAVHIAKITTETPEGYLVKEDAKTGEQIPKKSIMDQIYPDGKGKTITKILEEYGMAVKTLIFYN